MKKNYVYKKLVNVKRSLKVKNILVIMVMMTIARIRKKRPYSHYKIFKWQSMEN